MPETFIVCLVPRDQRAGGHHVGPFDDEAAARRYGERLEAASNHSLTAHVVTLARP